MSNSEVLIYSGTSLLLIAGLLYLYLRFSRPRDYVNVVKKRRY